MRTRCKKDLALRKHASQVQKLVVQSEKAWYCDVRKWFVNQLTTKAYGAARVLQILYSWSANLTPEHVSWRTRKLFSLFTGSSMEVAYSTSRAITVLLSNYWSFDKAMLVFQSRCSKPILCHIDKARLSSPTATPQVVPLPLSHDCCSRIKDGLAFDVHLLDVQALFATRHYLAVIISDLLFPSRCNSPPAQP
jgi:hypothetical protein